MTTAGQLALASLIATTRAGTHVVVLTGASLLSPRWWWWRFSCDACAQYFTAGAAGAGA